MVRAKSYFGLLLVLTLPFVLAARTQRPSDQHHNHQQDKQRVDGVYERGDHAMGFSHEKTTHHFRVKGGRGRDRGDRK